MRAVLLSVVSGCVWGTIAYFLTGGTAGKALWVGVVASPFIGVLVGLAAARIRKPSVGAGAVLLTFTGYIVILWPLSYLNHWLIWKLSDVRDEPIESGGNP